MKSPATMNITIPVSFFKEDEAFIAYSPVLDLSTAGETFEIVQERFAEIVEIFFEELTEMGTLNEVLQNLGWKKMHNQWHSPLPISYEMKSLSVPIAH